MRIQVVLVFIIFGVSGNREDWLTWQSWSACSVTCGKGFMKRVRQCSTSPQNCTGPREQRRPCRNSNCKTTTQQFPLAANVRTETRVWADWSAWSKPAVTCSNIPQVIKRTRNCPSESETETCEGFHTESRGIILPQCCASWSAWTPWSPPSYSCSFHPVTSTVIRAKVCTDTCDASSCLQPVIEKKSIPAPTCERTDSWAEWSQWSRCGLVAKLLSTRVRECHSEDQSCIGQYKQAKVCGLHTAMNS